MTQQVQTHLILGGARSGKSAYAEKQMCAWQAQNDGVVYYLATAPRTYPLQQADGQTDTEMLQRIAQHQLQRPSNWQTLEEPLYLAKALQEVEQFAATSSKKTAVLLDCLTLWMLNLIEADCREAQTHAFLDYLESTNLKLIVVSNEVGLGVVPMGKLSREFVDELGRLHQAVAQRVEAVNFVTAGLPMRLK
ncbi:bifunctional adenosylcobalamin biosynthesis protein CobP [Thiosulfatimonas sediminis]|uniref:Bifunctional adenosylcobalamin biosynthesis protein n=1 Tax=Thiosulfatimonas sediminis TaxID=2675054 RepID=A0A6F8PVQ0_9GAMM|nr:bifunctional adenosylcobinamide kinase/adenosylcobinamide-phosphate guanylyltransferase [Thiosulfatimonas sediminis]BBP46117.1 bifunctional adenosylcobalamin biosynthesis protein CobP [Thiosulfatimonas sediminis]